jgi:hypothetical protein
MTQFSRLPYFSKEKQQTCTLDHQRLKEDTVSCINDSSLSINMGEKQASHCGHNDKNYTSGIKNSLMVSETYAKHHFLILCECVSVHI